MSKVPKLRFKEFSGDWENKCLEELFSFKNGLNKEKEFFGKGTPIVNFTDVYKNRGLKSEDIKGLVKVNEKELSNYNVSKGDVFFTRTSETIDDIGMSTVILDEVKNTVFSGFVLRARPKNNNLSDSFKKYCFSTFNARKEIVTKSSFTTRALTSGTLLNGVEINYPSIEEQEKIASFFSLIDDKISLQGEKLEMLKDYKRGMMQKIFSRELRFKDDEGRDYPEWEHKKLSNIVERVTRKNKGIQSTLPLTISAQHGLVDQITFFNKTVASSNLEGYYLLENGEFAYNKSYSNGYPFGAIKRLDKYDKGVLSSLYICFRKLNNIDSDYLVQYFETSCWHKEISMIAVEGARNHGLLNISVADFFETYHWIPCYYEQVKIGHFLNKLDNKIQKEQDKLNSLNEYKKGLLQQMFV